MKRRQSCVVNNGRVTFTTKGAEVRVIPDELSELPVLQGFDGAEVLAALAGRFEQREFPAGSTIVAAGEPADQMFLIARGKVNKIGAGEYGDPTVLTVLAEGDHFGDRELVESHGTWACTVKAVTGCTVLTLPQRSFEELTSQVETLRVHVERFRSQAGEPDDKPGRASAAEGRSAREALAWSRVTVQPALRAAIDALPSSVRQVAGYHFGWWDENGHPTAAHGGKTIRPGLVLLAAEAVGGDPASAVPAAVAVELVHNFSLLHDDLMDGDVTRRHRRTAWNVFGANPAILAGDALLTLALDMLATSGHPAALAAMRSLSTAVLRLIDGQSADLAFETREHVELPECIAMAQGKTGALLGCACAVGALFGDGSQEQVEYLRRFGEQLGLAFQHVDDLLGIWGDPAVTGKPVYSDLRSRKKSLPVVAALTSGTAAGHELAALYHSGQPLSDSDLIRAAELIDAAVGRAWSHTQADTLLARALDDLHRTVPASRPAAELTNIARLATRRSH